jgi:hypothetical protein
MKNCYDGDMDDKPKMGSKSFGVSDKPKMTKHGGKGPKGGKKAGGGKHHTAHELHHHNRPHGHKGPKHPEGY